jgi:hypothetical protein
MRLSQELRDRTKGYASKVIGLYIKLPKNREEVRVLGRQTGTIQLKTTKYTSHTKRWDEIGGAAFENWRIG